MSLLVCVMSLRRDLLKLIGAREFSLEAIFQDPCRSFVLPEVRFLFMLCTDTQQLLWINVAELCANPNTVIVCKYHSGSQVGHVSFYYEVCGLWKCLWRRAMVG